MLSINGLSKSNGLKWKIQVIYLDKAGDRQEHKK